MRIEVHDDAVAVLEPEDLVLSLGPVFEAWPTLPRTTGRAWSTTVSSGCSA
jgi:hypothetical protein